MNLSKLSVRPRIPTPLARLEELAYNVWWSWNSDAQILYGRLDPELWDAVNHNPIKLLQRIEQPKLDAAAGDPHFIAAYSEVLAAFDNYMAPATPSWYSDHHSDRHNGDKGENVIAYFSAEFGLHEALPIYSGGLGILSGDHCKAASDLACPLLAWVFSILKAISRNGLTKRVASSLNTRKLTLPKYRHGRRLIYKAMNS